MEKKKIFKTASSIGLAAGLCVSAASCGSRAPEQAVKVNRNTFRLVASQDYKQFVSKLLSLGLPWKANHTVADVTLPDGQEVLINHSSIQDTIDVYPRGTIVSGAPSPKDQFQFTLNGQAFPDGAAFYPRKKFGIDAQAYYSQQGNPLPENSSNHNYFIDVYGNIIRQGSNLREVSHAKSIGFASAIQELQDLTGEALTVAERAANGQNLPKLKPIHFPD